MRILDKLEERGLIERRRHPTDRRIWLLFLREEARPLIAQMKEIGDATRGEALDGFRSGARPRSCRSLRMMKTNLVEACTQPVDDKEASHG